MADEHSFPALVAGQLLDDEGGFTSEFEEFAEAASSVLVLDQLDLAGPYADPLVVAAVVAAAIDRLTRSSPIRRPSEVVSRHFFGNPKRLGHHRSAWVGGVVSSGCHPALIRMARSRASSHAVTEPSAAAARRAARSGSSAKRGSRTASHA
ncbi:hypothetical protein [Streptomyces rhizosphaericus]|uniref:hypothetical protein n=1 Tax=Streptomyces rhizosphaericus TaxID=114699 RepID=UPI000A363BA5|nr:hypothetical protein [Streptomyces rhizosphaericus]